MCTLYLLQQCPSPTDEDDQSRSNVARVSLRHPSLQTAYRKISLKCHPDRSLDGRVEGFDQWCPERVESWKWHGPETMTMWKKTKQVVNVEFIHVLVNDLDYGFMFFIS